MEKFYDAVIVGGGPAGLAAAIYLGRAQYRVLVIEKEKIGGQITITSEVVNYPGVPKTDGKKLTEAMRKQAQYFGAEFLLAEVKELKLKGDKKYAVTDKGETEGLAILLATGASPRKAGFKGEMEFRGRGVAYCATCDGEFFTGKDVFVVGGGFAAAEEAIFLTRYAKKVKILVREPAFTCAGSIVDSVMRHEKIETEFNTTVSEAGGEGRVQFIVTKNSVTGEEKRYDAGSGFFGLFVFAGYEPATALFKDQLELNEMGYLVTDWRQQTSMPGVYGAGDVCVKELRQVVTAVSDGALAATCMEKYLFSMYEKLGLEKTERPVPDQSLLDDDSEQKNKTNDDDKSFISSEMKSALAPVFARFEKDIAVKVYLDDTALSREVDGFVEEMKPLCSKVHFQIAEGNDNTIYPMMSICDASGNELGMAFHGVPGGHEFNSFIIALYNASGPGQPADPSVLEKIHTLDREIHMKIAVSLSCTMCPEVVMASQRIAAENPKISAEMFDLAHYPELKERYQIMSVPCLIVNDEHVYFGKKSMTDIVALIEKI